jgi:hemoglobin
VASWLQDHFARKEQANMSDLSTTEDITGFMELFYQRLLSDPVAAPVFADVDMQAHMPRVVAFWANLAHGGNQYSGSPFQRHVPLNLTSEHFSIWYETFCSTLDELHAGPIATMVKERARSIAVLFSHKLGLAPPSLP